MNTPASGKPLARYAAWRRAGDLVFLSGVIAVDPAAGRIVRGYADIPPEAADLIGRTGEFSTDIKEGPILAQSWAVLLGGARGQHDDGVFLVRQVGDLGPAQVGQVAVGRVVAVQHGGLS